MKVLSEAIAKGKLDMGKIKILKAKDVSEWVEIDGSEVIINEEELFRIIN